MATKNEFAIFYSNDNLQIKMVRLHIANIFKRNMIKWNELNNTSLWYIFEIAVSGTDDVFVTIILDD